MDKCIICFSSTGSSRNNNYNNNIYMVKVHLLHPYYYPKAVVFSEIARKGK